MHSRVDNWTTPARDNTAPVFHRRTEAVNGEAQEIPTPGKCLGSTIRTLFLTRKLASGSPWNSA